MFLLAGALLALGVGAVSFLWRPTRVHATAATLRDLEPAVHGVGTVEAKVAVQVAAKITGRLVSVLVDQGDTVQAGQVLARLEASEQLAEIQRAEATWERARLAVTAQEAALRRAQVSLTAAEAVVSRVKATGTLARLNADRWRTLHDEGGVSRVEMDTRVTEAEVAEQELLNAEAQRRAALEEIVYLKTTLDMVRQDVRVAEAALASARARHADSVVPSPLDGFVVSRELEPGATVNPGTPILKIVDPHTAWVTVHVDERETAGLTLGDPAEINLRSLPGQSLRGRVARIRRESDRVTEQLAVDIRFEDEPPRLTLGEQAEATIRPAGKRGVTAIPLSALIRTADGPGVLKVVDGRLKFHPVSPGLADAAGWIEVTGGLRPGDQLVLAPGRLADLRNEGLPVRASNAETTANAGNGQPVGSGLQLPIVGLLRWGRP
jgi:HlyD family secretion protein